MSLRTNSGIHFSDPRQLVPITAPSASISMYDKNIVNNAASTTAFFNSGIASYGVIDITNWTSNTYKTIYSHTGAGLIHGMIACTAGGAETTTFEITIDGVLTEMTVTNANGDRAALWATGPSTPTEFSSASIAFQNATDQTALDASLTAFASTGSVELIPMNWAYKFGLPLLQYKISALVRMKHSASITNSTATAYSGVMVRKWLTA